MAGYRKLGKTADQRRALLRGLTTEVIKHGSIETTIFRAKEAQRQVDRMITLGKRNDLHARRLALSYIYDTEVVAHLFNEVAPKFADRKGGYTRITKLSARRGDGVETALLELVEQ